MDYKELLRKYLLIHHKNGGIWSVSPYEEEYNLKEYGISLEEAIELEQLTEEIQHPDGDNDE